MKVKWIDAYTAHRTSLEEVKKELGKIAICTTYGKKIYSDDRFVILEQHTATHTKDNSDYFIIPKALIINENKQKSKKKSKF